MNTHESRGTSQPLQTRVVEIVGAAGAGKTTLYTTLPCHTELIQLENFPDVRKTADAPFFIWNGLRLIPSLLSLYRPQSRHITRREFAWMTILRGWPALLREQVNEHHKVIVLDQGPVYLLAEMRLFGPEYLKQHTAERFWHDLFRSWSAGLDMIVWLDAANEVLMDRIRNRQQEHIVKDQPAATGYEFLSGYRREYEFILSMLSVYKPGLKVLKFDTDQQPTECIVKEFLSTLSC